MPTPLPSGEYAASNADLARSVFRDVKLEGATFDDVNLRGATFVNVALTNATIRNVCLGNVTIEDANYTGMRLDGILVTDLLRVYRERKTS